MKYIKLHKGLDLPAVGFGLYRISHDQMTPVVESAYALGYRHFDTAQMYLNEDALGKSLQELSIPRQEVLITTKIDNANQGYENTLASFSESCKRLQTDYVDQLLIHWPGQNPKRTASTWKALEKLYEEGLVKSIGLSNFTLRHLGIIEQSGNIKPMTNQIECNPCINQVDLIENLQNKNIVVIAWSPLKRGNLAYPILQKLADKYKKSPAQVTLRWQIQREIIVIPRSANPERQAANLNIFDFELTDQEMAAINDLHTGERTSHDPHTFDF